MRRKGTSTNDRVNETTLSTSQVLDVYEIYHNHPYTKRSRDAFVSMVLQNPPEIVMTSENKEAGPELAMVMQTYYLPFLQTMYDWLKMLGVCPWYYRRIRGTVHLYPCVPPWGSGYITTYLDKRHEQQFLWYWNDTREVDRNMHFERTAHVPSLTGTLTSPVSSLIADWKTQRIVRQSTDIAAYQQVRRQHIFEHHPAKNQIGDDNLTTLESFGEGLAADVMAMQEGLANAKVTLRSDALRDAITTTTRNNQGIRKTKGTGPFVRSEEHAEQWERENAGLLDHAVHLKPDFVYKPVPECKLDVRLDDYAKRMDQLAAAIMDVPLQLTESSGKHAQNLQGIMRFINERIKFWLIFFENVTRKIFVMAYGNGLQEEMRTRRPHSVHNYYIQDDIEVRIPVTPIASYDDLKKAYEDQLYTQHAFATHAFHALGLPYEDIAETVKDCVQTDDILMDVPRPPKKARTRNTGSEDAILSPSF